MAPPLAVAGGRQARAAGVRDRDHRALYDLAVLARLEDGAVAPLFTHRGAGPDGIGHRFGAPSRDGERLWLCTEREVRSWPDGERLEHPAFADLHHVAPAPEGLLAVATGAGGVVEARTGRFWPAHPGARAPTVDLRFEETHDPAHPSYVFVHRGATWVVRGASGDVAPLGGGAPTPVADVVIHDGVPTAEGVWLTAVDGRLILVEPGEGVRRTIRLDDGSGEPLGWVRGLWVDGDRAFVGATRLRATRWRRNLAWLRGTVRGTTTVGRRPTRVLEVSLADGRVRSEIPTEDLGLHAIFGLCPLPG